MINLSMTTPNEMNLMQTRPQFHITCKPLLNLTIFMVSRPNLYFLSIYHDDAGVQWCNGTKILEKRFRHSFNFWYARTNFKCSAIVARLNSLLVFDQHRKLPNVLALILAGCQHDEPSHLSLLVGSSIESTIHVYIIIAPFSNRDRSLFLI